MSVRTSLLLSAAVAAMASGSAFAADLPSRMAPVTPYVTAPPVFTWTGFYIGVNAGAAFGSSNNGGVTSSGFTAPAPGTAFIGGNRDDTRFTGGGQIGYNWQVGSFVYGLEADFNYLGNNNNSTVAPAGTATPYFVALNRNGSNFLGTVRGRLGYAVDRALFYVTGGLAYGSGSNGGGSVTYFPAGGGAFAYTSSGNNSNIGYAVGGGIEYAFSPHWSAKVEYLYVDRGNKSTTYFAPTGAPVGSSFVAHGHTQDNLLRVGLNYKF